MLEILLQLLHLRQGSSKTVDGCLQLRVVSAELAAAFLQFHGILAQLCTRRARKKVKSFPSHLAYRAALISASMALSQAPAIDGRPQTWGQCVKRCASLLLSLHLPKIGLKIQRMGMNPRSPVQRPNHLATLNMENTCKMSMMLKCLQLCLLDT